MSAPPLNSSILAAEAVPTQRETDLAAELKDAKEEIQAKDRRELELLSQLLEAKSTLLQTAQQREQRLTAQLQKVKTDLENEKEVTAQLEKCKADLEAAQKRHKETTVQILALKKSLDTVKEQDRVKGVEVGDLKAKLEFSRSREKNLEAEIQQFKMDQETNNIQTFPPPFKRTRVESWGTPANNPTPPKRGGKRGGYAQ